MKRLRVKIKRTYNLNMKSEKDKRIKHIFLNETNGRGYYEKEQK
jgi:hypothetical protein